MPYEIKKDGDQWCVHNKGGSKVKGGCHPTKKEAVDHMKALYKNVSDASVTSQRLAPGSIDLPAGWVDEFIDAVLASDVGEAPVLVTVRNVPIVTVGVEYELSTGLTTFTSEQLMDAVQAANEDHSIRKPRLKLGHLDPRYNDDDTYDGTPAFGKAINLRFDFTDLTVYGDYVGVPKWLADILPTAYPNKSVEGRFNVKAVSGKKYGFVITAVSLLGVVWPGVTNLEDLPQYYTEAKPPDVQILAGGGGMANIAAAANLDDVRRAFYNDFATAEAGRGWWWVRAVLVDPNELVVEDDQDGQLYRVSFTTTDDGEVTFGEPKPVRIEYVDQKPKAEKAAAKELAIAGMAVLAKTSAVYATRAESRPASTQGGAMDPKLIRQRLGLPEDASDEQVQSTLRELNEAAGSVVPTDGTGTTDPQTRQGLPEQQTPSTGDRGTDQVLPPIPPSRQAGTPEAGTGEEGAQSEGGRVQNPAQPGVQQPEATQPATPAEEAAASVVHLDPGAYTELQRQAQLGAQAFQRQQDAENTRIIDDALAKGKFPPSRKEAWEGYMKTDPEGARAALEALAPGLVPVDELGHGGSAHAAEEFDSSIWFPEVAARKAELEQRQGGWARIAGEV